MIQDPPPKNHSRIASEASSRGPLLLISLAGLNCLFQVAWFWRYCGKNINADAISYIGIARHIAGSDFQGSLHGYWSPLVSWLIAAASFVEGNYTRAARLSMLFSLVLCLFLIYKLTQRLWNSRLLSALAVLWFTAARGVVLFSVCFIGADLLLTAVTVIYFIFLWDCLKQPENPRKWLLLGMAHGVAFLAKAFAMPLLGLATVSAVVSSQPRSPRKAATALALAAIFPALLWVGWGTALRQKYGVFTTGYQLRWNLLDRAVRTQAVGSSNGLLILRNVAMTYDLYKVGEDMPRGSELWHVPIWRPTLLRQIVQKEIQNIPSALKEFLVLLTPGGIVALCLCVVQLTLARGSWPVHCRFAWIVLFTATALVLAYCMLVFDSRYVLPLAPVLMALGIRFAVPASRVKDLPAVGFSNYPRLQASAGVLLLAGLIATQVYWASPFRTVRQDFQESAYDAASTLKRGNARNVILIGTGPYPAHGMGWEAGFYTAYFADCRVLAYLLDLPSNLNPQWVATDVRKLDPDAVLVWGFPSDSAYSGLVHTVREASAVASVSSIRDPEKGEVGTVIVMMQKDK